MFDTALEETISIADEKMEIVTLNKKGMALNKESKRGKFIKGVFHRKQSNNVAAEKRILKKKKDELYKQLMEGLIKKPEYEKKVEELVPKQKNTVVEESKESTKDPRDVERRARKIKKQKAAKKMLASKVAGFQVQGFASEFTSEKEKPIVQAFIKECERTSNPKNKSKKFVREVPKEEDLVLFKRKVAQTKPNSSFLQKPRAAPKEPKPKVVAKKKSKYSDWTPKLDDLDIDFFIERDDKGKPLENIFCESGQDVSTQIRDVDEDADEILGLLKSLRTAGDWKALESEYPFLLNVVVFLIQICEANSILSYTTATYQFATIVTNKFSSAKQVVENFIKASYSLWTITAQSASQRVSSLVDKFSATMNSNLVSIFHKFVVQMVSFNILDKDITSSLTDYFGKEKPMNMIDFITFCGNSLATILKIGEGLAAGLPYSELLFTDDPVSAAIARTEMILAQHDNVYTGVHVDGQISINEYLTELKTCIDSLTAISKKLSLKPKKKIEVMKILPRALTSYNEKKNFLESTTRLTPYGILLVGPPGVGKSFIFIGIAKAFCEVLGIRYKTSLVYNQNAYSEYVEGYEPLSHVIWRIPELGSTSKDLVKKNGDPITCFLTSLIDRLPITVNSAFEGKGKVRVLVSAVIADTNTDDLNFDVLVKNPGAYERRFDLFDVRVLPEYQRDDSYRLDEAKSLASDAEKMDRWEFRIRARTPCPANPNTKSIEYTVLDWCRWSEFKPFFQDRVRKHFDKERAVQAAEAELIAEAGAHSWHHNRWEWYKNKSNGFAHQMWIWWLYVVTYLDFCFSYGTNSLALICLHIFAALLHVINPLLPKLPRNVIRNFLRFAIVPGIDYLEDRAWFAGDVLASSKLPMIAAGFITFAFLVKLYVRKSPPPDEITVCEFVKKHFKVGTVTYEQAINILASQTLYTATEHEFINEAKKVTGLMVKEEAVQAVFDKGIELKTMIEGDEDHQIVVDWVKNKFAITGNLTYEQAIGLLKGNKINTEASNFKLESPENMILNGYETEFECSDPPRKVKVTNSELWNTIYELPNSKCLNDPVQIHRSVMSNLRRLRLFINGKHFTTHILGIYGNHAVINEHALQGCDKLVVALLISDTHQSSFTFDRANSVQIAPDVLLFRVKHTNFRDIRDYFLPSSFPDLSCNGSVGHTPVRVHFINAGMVMHEPFSGKDIALPRYLHYSVEHYAGMCGMPIFARATSGYHVVGIHCAASDIGNNAYGAPMIGSKFPEIDDGTLPISSEGTILTQAQFDPVSKSPFVHEHFPCIKYLGKIPGPTMLNSVSQLTTTKFYKEVPELLGTKMRDDEGWLYGAPPMKPVVVDGEWHSPYNNALRKMNRPQIALDPAILARVKSIVVERLRPAFRHCRPTTIEAAINGIEADNVSRRINVRTSAGVGLPGKKINYLPIVEESEKLVREPIEDIKKRINAKIKDLMEGRTTETLFKASPKDEAREREKNKRAKTRLFYGVQLDSLILQRMFLFPFFSQMIEHAELFCTGIGINMHADADQFVKQLIEFAKTLMEGDYEGFEFNVPYLIAELAASIIYELMKVAGYPKPALKVLSSILTEMLFPVICIALDIVQCPGMQPSGCYATAEFNSFKQLLVLIYVYIALTNRNDFFEQVLPRTYGDDLLAAIKSDVLVEFNNVTFAHYCMNHLKLNFTPSSKSGEHKEFLCIEEASFLKRNFHFNKILNKWTAPLNLISVSKALMLMIPSKSISLERQQMETMNAMLFELFLSCDSPEQYEYFLNAFVLFAQQLGFSEEESREFFPTGNELCAHFGITA